MFESGNTTDVGFDLSGRGDSSFVPETAIGATPAGENVESLMRRCGKRTHEDAMSNFVDALNRSQSEHGDVVLRGQRGSFDIRVYSIVLRQRTTFFTKPYMESLIATTDEAKLLIVDLDELMKDHTLANVTEAAARQLLQYIYCCSTRTMADLLPGEILAIVELAVIFQISEDAMDTLKKDIICLLHQQGVDGHRNGQMMKKVHVLPSYGMIGADTPALIKYATESGIMNGADSCDGFMYDQSGAAFISLSEILAKSTIMRQLSWRPVNDQVISNLNADLQRSMDRLASQSESAYAAVMLMDIRDILVRGCMAGSGSGTQHSTQKQS